MKLSEAIMLGRHLMPAGSVTAGSFCGCALAMGLRAAVQERELPALETLEWYVAEREQWPWLTQSFPVPEVVKELFLFPIFQRYKEQQAEAIISALFHRVRMGKLTLEQLVDWVASVEPQPTAALAANAACSEVLQNA